MQTQIYKARTFVSGHNIGVSSCLLGYAHTICRRLKWAWER